MLIEYYFVVQILNAINSFEKNVYYAVKLDINFGLFSASRIINTDKFLDNIDLRLDLDFPKKLISNVRSFNVCSVLRVDRILTEIKLTIVIDKNEQRIRFIIFVSFITKVLVI